MLHFLCRGTVSFPSSHSQVILICYSEASLTLTKLKYFLPHTGIVHAHYKTSVSITSGHTDHYLNFILIHFFSNYIIYQIYPYLFLLKSICVLFVTQEKNTIHYFLLPSLLRRVQRYLQIIFLG